MHKEGNSMKEKDISGKNARAGMSRREFVGAVGAGIGTICILGAPGIVAAAEEPAPRIRSILYDSTKCIGCHTCEFACKTANGLPEDTVKDEASEATETTVISETPATTVAPGAVTTTATEEIRTGTRTMKIAINDDLDADSWVNVKLWEKTLTGGTVNYYAVRQACMHCGSCAKVCPAKAIVQREDGIVTVDPDKCIGCHYCYQACPFDIPRYGEDGTMRKCIMCNERVDAGKEPACVEACPTNALTFGYRDDLVDDGGERVVELVEEGYSDAYLYGGEELGGTPLMYALPYSFDNYGLPKLPLEAQIPVTWKDFGMPVGIIAGLAALAFGGITYIRSRGEKADKEKPSKE